MPEYISIGVVAILLNAKNAKTTNPRETEYNKRHGGSSSLGVSTPRYGLASQGPARKRPLG
jgi:hypothetical protein